MKMSSIVILTLLISCATKAPRRNALESTKVLSALKSSGLQGIQNGATETFRAENLTCLRDLSKDAWKCGFVNNGRNYEVPEKESGELSGILFNLPVAQGDSGAATPFIECRMYDRDPENARCDVAISLDYQGP